MDRLQAARRGAGVGLDRRARPLLHPVGRAGARRVRHAAATRARAGGDARRGARLPRRPPAVAARRGRGAGPARPVRRPLRAERHGEAVPGERRAGLDGRPDPGRSRCVLRPARRGHVHHHVPVCHPGRPEDPLFGDARPPGARSRGRRGAVVDRRPRPVPRGHGRGQRPAGGDRGGGGEDGRARRGRPVRVPGGRLPRDRHRGRRVRPGGARPRVPHRGRRRGPPPDRAGVPGPEARRAAAAGRLLPRHGTQVQPPRRADGHHHDGEHRERVHLHPQGLLRVAHRGGPIGFQQTFVATKPRRHP